MTVDEAWRLVLLAAGFVPPSPTAECREFDAEWEALISAAGRGLAQRMDFDRGLIAALLDRDRVDRRRQSTQRSQVEIRRTLLRLALIAARDHHAASSPRIRPTLLARKSGQTKVVLSARTRTEKFTVLAGAPVA